MFKPARDIRDDMLTTGSYMTASELTQSVVNAVNDGGVFETGGATAASKTTVLRKSFHTEVALPQNQNVVGKVPQGQQATENDRIFTCFLCSLMIAFKKYMPKK